ncbi:MAG: hypothetical protein N2712_07960 [Brevinematales bacterium]|nr:hypothetical protein [Brevinematales bacterium]
MSKKYLFVFFIVLLITGLIVCKKKIPTTNETRAALRECVQKINTDVLNNKGGLALQGSVDILEEIPLINKKKIKLTKMLRVEKKEIPRVALLILNKSTPWDTFAGKWRWNQTNQQWEHYSTTPNNAIIFEWVWTDSLSQVHDCVISISEYQFGVVGGEDVLTKVKVDLKVDNTTYFLVDLKEIRYGTTSEDIRKVDMSIKAVNIKFTFNFDYTSVPTTNFLLRFEYTNDKPWYQIKFKAKDNTPPFGDEVIAQNGTYTDYNKWQISVNFQEPDNDGIQLVSGEITKKGALAATIKSEKRFNDGNPYLYVWLVYADGTTETPEQLFADIFP